MSENFSSGKHDPFSKLVYELSRLPGVGEKTATRLAYFILKQDPTQSRALAEAILSAKEKIGLCGRCFTFTDQDLCRICASAERNQNQVCVVERPADVFAVEQSGVHRGVYHVLHGALSPLDGIGPDELRIRELLNRVNDMTSGGASAEVILATNPSVEGEATALYLARLLKPFGIRLTKLAHGLPVGGMLEYSDRQTIGRALENRVEMG